MLGCYWYDFLLLFMFVGFEVFSFGGSDVALAMFCGVIQEECSPIACITADTQP